jgi:hypothetical protein
MQRSGVFASDRQHNALTTKGHQLDEATHVEERPRRKKRPSFDADELHWYALDVVRQKEFVIGFLLQKRGCATFIPTETRFRKKNRYSKGGKLEVAYAAIPGTIFVGFDGPPNWFELMNMHLVNGVLSADNQPHRIDTASREWIEYRSTQTDGSLSLERQVLLYRGGKVERSVPIIHLQGRGVLRSPLSIRAKAGKDRPIVVPVKGRRADMLRRFFTTPQPVLAVAA